MSYNWSHQGIVKRINAALQGRGYATWIHHLNDVDIEKMQGSTVEAMSAAVEDAVVVVYGITQTYKESANCRLEAQYAMQQEKNLVPLLLEEGYKPAGWLGMLLGVRLWYGFFGSVVASEAAFEQKMGELCRELETAVKLAAPAAPAAALSTQPPQPPPPKLADLARTPTTAQTATTTSSAAAAAAVPPTHHSDSAAAAPPFWQQLQQLRAENQQLRQSLHSLQGQLGALECLTADGLAALQHRLRQLREGGLLTAEEAAALQDSVADFVVAEPCLLGRYCAAGGAVHTMARLSAAFAGEDGDFARQLRRKCM